MWFCLKFYARKFLIQAKVNVMKPRTLVLLVFVTVVNLALALLPIFDTINIRSWIALGSSITGVTPVMAGNVWPGGFFSFMAFTPLYLSYVFSGFNVYLSVAVLKLILFVFTFLTAFLLYRVTQKIMPAHAETVLLFTLLNPAVLYINYFWAQIDVLPVYFFTLGFILLRFVDFGQNHWKRYALGFLPIIISAFIYRYALILLPTLVLFDSGSIRQRVSALFVAGGGVAFFFGVEYFFFRGGFYNYVGALSGSVINMSSVQGFQYWLSIPQLPYIVFLCVLGFVVPLLLKWLKYTESVALFLVLLFFVYTSTVPLADYFLWLYPVGVFVALQSFSRVSFNKRLLLTGLPLYVALFFISFLIGNGVQTGPFYFAYPLISQDVALLAASSELYVSGVFWFNLFLLGSVVVVTLFCLSKSNKRVDSVNSFFKPVFHWRLVFSKRKKFVLAGLVFVLVFLGFCFNGVYSQPVVASNEGVFPLYLFPANNMYDSMPMGSTYYLSWNGLVVYNNGSVPISFNHALTQQNANLSVDFNLRADCYGSYDLVKVDNYTMGVSLKPNVLLSNLSAVEPSVYNGEALLAAAVDVFDDKVSVYEFGLNEGVSYRLSQSLAGNYYTFAFKFKNSSLPQSLLFHFSNSKYLFDYSISNNMQWVFIYDLARHNSTSFYHRYNVNPDDDWNVVVFKPAIQGFYSWVNNESFSLKGRFFGEDTDLAASLYYTGNATRQVGGYLSQLYSSKSFPSIQTEYLFFVDLDSNREIESFLNSSQLNLSLTTSQDNTVVNVGDKVWTIGAVDWLSFGKLTWGNYGLMLTLDRLELYPENYGYYLVPVYFAVVVPFVVAALSLPLLFRQRESVVG